MTDFDPKLFLTQLTAPPFSFALAELKHDLLRRYLSKRNCKLVVLERDKEIERLCREACSAKEFSEWTGLSLRTARRRFHADFPSELRTASMHSLFPPEQRSLGNCNESHQAADEVDANLVRAAADQFIESQDNHFDVLEDSDNVTIDQTTTFSDSAQPSVIRMFPAFNQQRQVLESSLQVLQNQLITLLNDEVHEQNSPNSNSFLGCCSEFSEADFRSFFKVKRSGMLS